MAASLKMVRTVRNAMLAVLVLQVFASERTPHAVQSTSPAVYGAITFLAIVMIAAIFIVRRAMVTRAEQTLVQNADDSASLSRWRAGYVITYALCEAVALYGIVLRFMGFKREQVLPFYLAGFILLVFFAPRRPSNTIG